METQGVKRPLLDGEAGLPSSKRARCDAGEPDGADARAAGRADICHGNSNCDLFALSSKKARDIAALVAAHNGRILKPYEGPQ